MRRSYATAVAAYWRVMRALALTLGIVSGSLIVLYLLLTLVLGWTSS